MSKPKPRRLLQILAHPELAALNMLPTRQANELRTEAIQAAFRSLSLHEQGSLHIQAEGLALEVPKLSAATALEVLAAIGIALDDADWPKDYIIRVCGDAKCDDE